MSIEEERARIAPAVNRFLLWGRPIAEDFLSQEGKGDMTTRTSLNTPLSEEEPLHERTDSPGEPDEQWAEPAQPEDAPGQLDKPAGDEQPAEERH
jgi:hypothetical protein